MRTGSDGAPLQEQVSQGTGDTRPRSYITEGYAANSFLNRTWLSTLRCNISDLTTLVNQLDRHTSHSPGVPAYAVLERSGLAVHDGGGRAWFVIDSVFAKFGPICGRSRGLRTLPFRCETDITLKRRLRNNTIRVAGDRGDAGAQWQKPTTSASRDTVFNDQLFSFDSFKLLLLT
jgi:hypothetical protein